MILASPSVIVDNGGTLVEAGIVAAVAMMLVWFARALIEIRDLTRNLPETERSVVEVRDKVRTMSQSLYGSKEASGKEGIMATLEATGKAVYAIDAKVADIEKRVEAVEGTCVAMHGKVIMRGSA